MCWRGVRSTGTCKEKGGLGLTSINCCIAPRNSRKQHGLPINNCGDHSSMTMKPMSSSGASIVSSIAVGFNVRMLDGGRTIFREFLTNMMVHRVFALGR